MKLFTYIILAALTCIACENEGQVETTTTTPVSSTKYSMNFKTYTVNNVNLFKGPSGNSITADESYIQNYWSLYKESSWKKVELDLENMTVKLVADNASDLKYNISIKQDSVFIKENSNTEYFGNFDKSTSSLKLKRVFKYIKKAPADSSQALFISKTTGFGIANYNNIFPSSTFSGPGNMTNSGDEVFWANITYNYSSN
ncbi:MULTISPECIES: hypothetical protein [Chryseobacterium]|uniref:hypothetical protein n=1 Tax=Chryseobacterium TaxID=59732 RepID=UPI000919435B|nr:MULTISPECIES: hypothetical protein [Chryseobacterium]MCY0970758.1 hypothetical protein [Chryseobacterium sp. CY353]REC39778.1 hypothetical protein DRF69_21625 [Chryseobacterium sp. 5_R23647]SHN06285.1 hypothetical protein SAMN05444360_13315 [Chryseobacterium carnipullorum]